MGVTGPLVDVSSCNTGNVRTTERGDLTDASACLKSWENPMSFVVDTDAESNEFRLGCDVGKLDIVIFSDELVKRRDAAASKQRESPQERDPEAYSSLCAEEESWLSPSVGLLRIEEASCGRAELVSWKGITLSDEHRFDVTESWALF